MVCPPPLKRMIELSKDKKSGTWIITKTDKEGFHKQLNVTVREMVDLFMMFKEQYEREED